MKKWISRILLCLTILAFCFNYEVFKLILPEFHTNYEQSVKYFEYKDGMNDVIFMSLFFVIFLNSQKYVRSLSFFGFVVTFASVMDKVIFDVHSYLYSDVVVLIFAVCAAFLIYRNERLHTGATR